MKKIIFSFLLSVIIINLQGQTQKQLGINRKVYLSSGVLNCTTSQWKLVFYDEFNGESIDTTKWVTYFPYAANGQCEFCRTHGNEGQIYKNENVVVNNGSLKLIAKHENATWYEQTREYTSGMIHSTALFSFYYGKFVMRGKIPSGMGFWPAFWLYGSDGNEIDIFEFAGDKPAWLYTNLHTDHNNKNYDWQDHFVGPDYSNNFHVYSVEWEPNQIIYKVDGNEIRSVPRYWTIQGKPLYCNASISSGYYIENLLMPHNPLRIILNLAIGVTNVTPFTNSPNSNTVFPNQFEIDYIRVYQRNPQSGFANICSDRYISGDSTICNEQSTYTFHGKYSNLKWTASSNLGIDNVNGNSITVHPFNSSVNELAWVKVSDDIPCNQNTFSRNIWIGEPKQPVTNPSGYPTVPMSLGEIKTIRIISAKGNPFQYVWNVSGSIEKRSGGEKNITVEAVRTGTGNYYIKTKNKCGYSPIGGGTVSVSPEGGGVLLTYPNPVTNTLTVELKKTKAIKKVTNNKAEVRIYNKMMILKKRKYFTGGSTKINVSNLFPDVYTLQVIIGEKIYEAKIIISRK